jgi:hypothetical protein
MQHQHTHPISRPLVPAALLFQAASGGPMVTTGLLSCPLLSCPVLTLCPVVSHAVSCPAVMCCTTDTCRGRGRGRHARDEDDEDAELLQDEENDGASNQVGGSGGG